MHRSFIFQQYLEDPSICDALVEYIENSPDKVPGVVGCHEKIYVDTSIKDSVDVQLNGSLLKEYMGQLQTVANAYIEKYPMCNVYAPWRIMELPNIQKYNPNGGFLQWHTERDSSERKEIASRHLVFMTYLNDVTDGGETEFMMQEVKVQPRRGLTLIWPADWTHTHRGVTSMTQTKYVVTGWYCFV